MLAQAMSRMSADEAQQDEQRRADVAHENSRAGSPRCTHARVGGRDLGRQRRRDGGEIRVRLPGVTPA